MTTNGPELRSDAVPEVAQCQRCRVCFVRNSKLYSMRDDESDLARPPYGTAYETLTGLSIKNKFSPYLCIKCADQLLKCIKFRDRCLRAHTILRNINYENDNITTDIVLDVSICHDPLITNTVTNETDGEFIDSDIKSKSEVDIVTDDCSYSFKSESIDIVEHGVVFPHQNTENKGTSTNFQDDSTASVKIENDILNKEVEDISNLICSPDLEKNSTNNVTSNFVVLENIASIKSHSRPVRYKMKKHSRINSDSIEDVFRGEDCPRKEILHSKKALHKDKMSSSKLKGVKTIQENMNQNEEQRKQEPSGLLLRYTFLTCDICNYQTVNKDQLMQHLKDHSAEKAYSCGTCYFLTNSKKNLLVHKELHCNKKHSCSYCEKIFTFKCDLRSHLRIHTGDKPYSCDICMKKFRQHNQLTAHLKVHTGEKPHLCNVCKKAFRQKGQLQNHLRIHSGEKPYTCSICNKAFIQRGQLQNHLNMHTNEKKYECDTCGKSFKVKGTLHNHMQVHAK